MKIKVNLDIFTGPYLGEIDSIKFLQDIKARLLFDSPMGVLEINVHQGAVFKELISILKELEMTVTYEFKTEYGSILEESPSNIVQWLNDYLNSIK